MIRDSVFSYNFACLCIPGHSGPSIFRHLEDEMCLLLTQSVLLNFDQLITDRPPIMTLWAATQIFLAYLLKNRWFLGRIIEWEHGYLVLSEERWINEETKFVYFNAVLWNMNNFIKHAKYLLINCSESSFVNAFNTSKYGKHHEKD